jgi:protein gp37
VRRPRTIDPAWVRDIRDPCIAANVPFFFKQWGGRNKKKGRRPTATSMAATAAMMAASSSGSRSVSARVSALRS